MGEGKSVDTNSTTAKKKKKKKAGSVLLQTRNSLLNAKFKFFFFMFNLKSKFNDRHIALTKGSSFKFNSLANIFKTSWMNHFTLENAQVD